MVNGGPSTVITSAFAVPSDKKKRKLSGVRKSFHIESVVKICPSKDYGKKKKKCLMAKMKLGHT